jgi:hypothetical protein
MSNGLFQAVCLVEYCFLNGAIRRRLFCAFYFVIWTSYPTAIPIATVIKPTVDKNKDPKFTGIREANSARMSSSESDRFFAFTILAMQSVNPMMPSKDRAAPVKTIPDMTAFLAI